MERTKEKKTINSELAEKLDRIAFILKIIAHPTRLGIVRRLPKYEVRRVFFVRRYVDPGACDLVIARPARQLAVLLEGRHMEQHVPFSLVGIARLNQSFYRFFRINLS